MGNEITMGNVIRRDNKVKRTRKTDITGVLMFLGLVAAFWIFTFITLKLLQPYALAYNTSGKITAGYLAYAVIGILFTTPAPFLSALILALVREKQSLKSYLGSLFRVEDHLVTWSVTAVFCALAMGFALLNGEPVGAKWFMMPLGFLIMIPLVGIAEEAGWRGYLQPKLEKRFGFIPGTLMVGAVWFVWHIDQWFDPASNHYGDSLVGFAICILIWAFVLAAIYKATKSVLACAVYHGFVDSIGAVYDWNLLFDPAIGDWKTVAYRALTLAAAFALWIYADDRERKALS